MKTKLFALMALCACLSFQACDDDEIRYTLIKAQTYERNILIEDFTGVRCPNCPKAADEIRNLQAIYPDNIIPVAIHTGFFAFKFPESKYDFKTTDGDDIEKLMGSPVGYPAGAINRIYDDEQASYFRDYSFWGAAIATQIQQAPKIELELENTFDIASRTVSAKVKVKGKEAINQETRVTVLVIESGMIDPQIDSRLNPDKNPAYVHNHVLRDVITSSTGDFFASSIGVGEEIEKTFQYTLPPEAGWWVAGNCQIVAFVSLSDGSLEVLQVKEKHVIE